MRVWKLTLTLVAGAALMGCEPVDTTRSVPVDTTTNGTPTTTNGAPMNSGAPTTTTTTTTDGTTPATIPDGTTPRTTTPDGNVTRPVEPDNTAKNQRDANTDLTKTPIDQDENQADINRTAEIRKRIIDTPDMSINARNVKIITSQGKVTLRGPVNSEAERDLVVKIAKDVAGEANVDNQVEVAPANTETNDR